MVPPLFIAQEALCFYPISTIYDSCPRYLFYALLLASCLTRWTGWLADVFLGAAAAYAGTAAIEAFILVSSDRISQEPTLVTIPFVAENSTLWSSFPQLVTQTDQIILQPSALELDGDAVMAIVVTGYLVFLPLQCWSRVLTQERARNLLFYLWNILMLAGSICALVCAAKNREVPTQYMFCYPDVPPYESTSSDGWENFWRTSTWNSSVWDTFSNVTKWGEIGDICYNPCFNTSQILRQATTLESWVLERGSESSHGNRFWDKLIYSNRYIYSLIILCFILNIVLLTFKFLPYRSRIPSAQIVVIWKTRKDIWKSFKDEFQESLSIPRNGIEPKETYNTKNSKSCWNGIRPFFTIRFLRAFLRIIADLGILFGLLFSMIISPLTIIGFVAWVEWWIHNDGPSQENPQQVGQWSYLVSIGLLVISAAILTLKYRLASTAELDNEIETLRAHLEKLEERRDARMEAQTASLTAENSQDP
ncbi:uncharacterized protein N7484_008043 [Penicillium longicatenatum]|uniref:uncharacterized protein n=1 Tax=Penicillium longicatenatum TaxID=1561947 RepID=UPI002547F9DA|nr:uncharacterized protein N7484_008043 [Penicillium longicatenatum]KAJ5640181.1 hypothetical protein N7484_008043 [Penicillium longicatenatum]